MTRRALVTGATGGLGRTLVPMLIEAGYAVTATGRDAAIGATLGTRFIAADLIHDRLEPLLDGIDTVFHLAALSSPWGRRADFEAINVAATRRLLVAARAAGCGGFIHASTPSIYAAPRDRLQLTEADPPAKPFASHYASTKYAAERMVLAADASDLRTVAIRPRAIVGPHDTVLLPRLLRAARRGRLPLPGGGAALIELTDVRDASAAFIAADARRDTVGGQAFNISGGAPRPVRDIAARVLAAAGVTARVAAIPTGPALALARAVELAAGALPGRPEPPVTRYSVMILGYSQTFNLSAAKSALGWHPRYSPEEAIAAAFAGRDHA